MPGPAIASAGAVAFPSRGRSSWTWTAAGRRSAQPFPLNGLDLGQLAGIVLICRASPFFCITQAWPNVATAQSVEKSSWLPLNRGSNTQRFSNEASIIWTAQNSHHDFSFLTYKDYTDNQEVFWVYLLCYEV